jgi:antibiotic biosynthesis monooxygenase (ABM) superfamily enzyme
MEAPERGELLAESKAFIDHEQLMRLATSFPGWVPINPVTGKGPPNWKTALLVTLGLFPIVMLEMRFLSPILASLGLHSSLAIFIGNCISVAGTTFVTMPLFIRSFGWWLFTEKKTPAWIAPAGLGLLAILFAIEVGALWYLLPW